MTKEEKEKLALEEWHQALKESIEEEKKITEKLKSEGRYIEGLDTNSDDYKPVNEKLKRRLKEIQSKYGE